MKWFEVVVAVFAVFVAVPGGLLLALEWRDRAFVARVEKRRAALKEYDAHK
jgi:hypothetical protein